MAKITAAAIVAVSFVLCSAAVAFDLQGHRGARGLAPENTAAARSRNVSGVSGWKFAGLRARSMS